VGAAEAVTDTGIPTVAVELFAGAVRETVVEKTTETFTLTVIDVAVVPLESVTRAVREKIPDAVGVHVVEYGAVSAVPTTVVPTRKSTLLTVAPPTALAVALIVLALPKAILAPLVGEVIATVGVVDATTTLTAEDMTVAELESVTRAVNTKEPLVVGVQEVEYGAETAEPTSTGLDVWFEGATKKSTRETVAGVAAKAVAVRFTAEPMTRVEPAVGTVSEMVGAVTFTFTVVEVTLVPLESVARAVRAKTPDAEGDHVIEYGADSADPTTALPARKSTRLTVAPLGAVAVAVSVVCEPKAITVPVAGPVSATVGTAELAMVTVADADITAAEFESVTLAERLYEPELVGVHVVV
jgi:hypothetical protein